jgi:hypothetical protein
VVQRTTQLNRLGRLENEVSFDLKLIVAFRSRRDRVYQPPDVGVGLVALLGHHSRQRSGPLSTDATVIHAAPAGIANSARPVMPVM